MTKETKIQMEWIELGFEPSSFDEGGWIDFNDLPEDFDIGNLDAKHYQEPDVDYRTTLVRPKDLRGLEDNNGWIKIDSEADLPKDKSIEFDICRFEKDGTFVSDKAIGYSNLKLHVRDKLITHYKPTDVLNPPLY
ncbi:hypothetical protein [Flavobacterium sp. CF136]|uniref:hypothetical protein n=1 Tax=Flavobacterium sp. (strain CF136) TaxID=1144313 RepID=UPI0002719F02|nr:hypothetical protein [Flavobacterium sp. CF136]EJL66288.1 hypothetical protein PMI10_00636 [Flavobacterium sp. CF136]